MKKKIKEHKLDWEVDSAGTESYHIGQPPHKFSIGVCMEKGINISKQRARKFTLEDFEKFDKIYAMADDVYTEIRRIGKNTALMNKVDYFLNELKAGSNSSVPDPWYGTEDGFKPVFELINKTCDAIIENYANKK